ncbi:SWPV2-ORF009 [Shearwaterpox virus]|uniref:SWPV2-ORF009 n=1 Tax=Shearwaterpox virus TaxID=1974596 RepID=A0A1V0QFX2_CNPV|nr:SWPV2-ORF009 [Shearwaterpox virus]QRI42730.1 hypothetical protein ChPV012 [Cheloniid poxvirus 1]QRM15289.1 hypothetical protein [Mudlarkpox virus]QRM15642.1 hypothetical protein [Penguinpox virus 2]QRM15972.1 hypothetical protein [Albatrosspox virus]
MVIITNITDPEAASCLRDVTTYGSGVSLLQVNGTVTTPRDILKAYDDDTRCKFLRSCIIFTMYIGCFPDSIEYSSGCFTYITRNGFLNMTKSLYNEEFYIPLLNTTLDRFCMIIAPRVITSQDIEHLNEDEPCKYVRDLGMTKPYNDGRDINCLNITDIRYIKNSIIY